MQVNNNQSVMDKLSSWMGSNSAPAQQGSDFQAQLLKLRNSGLSQSLAGQNSLTSNSSSSSSSSNSLEQSLKGSGLELFGSSENSNILNKQFTAIGEGIGIGLLAAFAGKNGGAPQFGTTGDKTSATAATSATNTTTNSSTTTNTSSTSELTGMNAKNLTFGVKSDKPQGANNPAPGANPPPPPAGDGQNAANNTAQNDTQQNNAAQTANDSQTANAPAEPAGSSSWNPFSNFFKDLFGGDKPAAANAATADTNAQQNGTDTTA